MDILSSDFESQLTLKDGKLVGPDGEAPTILLKDGPVCVVPLANMQALIQDRIALKDWEACCKAHFPEAHFPEPAEPESPEPIEPNQEKS